MSKQIVSPPPAPDSAPSDWSIAVDGNAFDNIERLGLWTGGANFVSGDPSGNFAPVELQSLGAGDVPPAIYVITHGWAPGFIGAVSKAQGNILWWGPNASEPGNGGVWASNWAWSPVVETYDDGSQFQISPNGLLQQIFCQDPNAIILAYSWIDNSATDEIDLENPDALPEVYRSEAYTHANGLRLADALVKAIAPSYWTSGHSQLRLIGHSHGSKVVTVAAYELQKRLKPVAKLTILDAPESETTLAGNAANLLGFYLQRLTLASVQRAAPGVFVDNYPSCFGVCYGLDPQLASVVEAALAPSEIYGDADFGDLHTYAAGWYGGEAQGAKECNEEPVGGLAWTSPPTSYSPVFNQQWQTQGPTPCGQWDLQSGSPIQNAYSYAVESLVVTPSGSEGSVTGEPASGLVFSTPSSSGGFSTFQGTYNNLTGGYGYGVAIDVAWSNPQPGDYLVIAMETPEPGWPMETLLVMDGRSAPSGQTSVAIPSFVSNVSTDWPLDITIYFYASTQNSSSVVTLSNFNLVDVFASNSLSLRSLRRRKAKTGPRLSAYI